MPVSAGYQLNIISQDSTSVMFQYSQQSFGRYGGVLCVDYNKVEGSSESGFTVFTYQSPNIPDSVTLFDDKARKLSRTLWQLAEVDAEGIAVPWSRDFTSSCQMNFPLPLNSSDSKVYVKLRWLGDVSNITSEIVLHIINNS